jgi:hypothetical protein
MEPVREGTHLGSGLEAVCRNGAAFVPGFLTDSFRRALLHEIADLPFEPAPEEVGPVRQLTETFEVRGIARDLPRLEELRRELGRRVRETGVRGLATWRPNDVAVQRYRRPAAGITPHLDGKRYRRLVAVVTLEGSARFAICRDRGGEEIEAWEVGRGDLVLLRGPGLCGHRDGRPFHTVSGPREGAHLSVGFRMDSRPA